MTATQTDLRARLEARKQRIAAGLPAPYPVTVTPSFFEENMSRTAQRECSVCRTMYTPRGGKGTTCSPACLDKRNDRIRGDGKFTLTCVECDAEFTSNYSGTLTCSEGCKKERKGRMAREWHIAKGKDDKEPGMKLSRTCAAEGCEREFVPLNSVHKTCGAMTCRNRYHAQKMREHRKSHEERKKLAAMMAAAERKGRA